MTMRSALLSAFVLLIILEATSGFYLPGVAPREFKDGAKVNEAPSLSSVTNMLSTRSSIHIVDGCATI